MSFESNNAPVDPRIQEEKCEFKKLLAESVEKIKQASHKLGNAIEAAKPYYEARLYANQLSKETQMAAVNYEKARSIHAAAKEMVYLAEQGLGEKSTLDTACQEMLSHAASKVNQSQLECTETRNLLKINELKQEVANNRVAKLQAQLKSAIKASRPYYETRANYNGLLKTQKEKITTLENKIAEAKMNYNEALKSLEQISEEIHKMREEKRNNCLTFNNCLEKNTISNSIKHQNHINHNSNIIQQEAQSEYKNNILPKQLESYTDEYLDFPPKLTTKSSPIHQRHLDKHDCPHLLRDFEHSSNYPKNIIHNTEYAQNKYASTSTTNPAVTTALNANDEIEQCFNSVEQWTEIRLSNSESTSSSGYSHHSAIIDDHTISGSSSETSSSDDNKKITCTTVFNNSDDSSNEKNCNKKSSEGITTWISRSSSFRNSGRRQSLDILIDASDKVKDVFTSSFQKVGRSLERRNSESEVNNDNSEFFLFSRSEKDALSDEQVENLMLNDEDGVNGVLTNISYISK